MHHGDTEQRKGYFMRSLFICAAVMAILGAWSPAHGDLK